MATKKNKTVAKTVKKTKTTAKKVGKEVNKSAKSAKEIKISSDIQILLRQHVGKPCVPQVKKGDKVVVGQLIAVPQGLGANIHITTS